MKNTRTLAKVVAGIVLVTGASLGAAAPAQAGDTGWNGTKIIKEKPKQNGDTGWNGT